MSAAELLQRHTTAAYKVLQARVSGGRRHLSPLMAAATTLHSCFLRDDVRERGAARAGEDPQSDGVVKSRALQSILKHPECFSALVGLVPFDAANAAEIATLRGVVATLLEGSPVPGPALSDVLLAPVEYSDTLPPWPPTPDLDLLDLDPARVVLLMRVTAQSHAELTQWALLYAAGVTLAALGRALHDEGKVDESAAGALTAAVHRSGVWSLPSELQTKVLDAARSSAWPTAAMVSFLLTLLQQPATTATVPSPVSAAGLATPLHDRLGNLLAANSHAAFSAALGELGVGLAPSLSLASTLLARASPRPSPRTLYSAMPGGPGTLMLGSLRVTSQAGAPTLIALPLHFEAMLAKACLMECLRCSHRPETPVLCLQCGALLCGGDSCCRAPGVGDDDVGGPGECTRHARECGPSGCPFFIVSTCTVLLIRNGLSTYYHSLYADEHEEEDCGLQRRRLMVLNTRRFDALQQLWLNHEISNEITSMRLDAKRFVRLEYY